MAASVLACLFFIFFLPCFSNSCTPKLPCDPSIQIKPPFNFQSDLTMGLNCPGYLTIGCNNNMSFLSWLPKPFSLESISYENNTFTVQDPSLSISLRKSGCRNLHFNFFSPVSLYLEMYDLLNSSLSSMKCGPSGHIQSLPNIFRKDYNLSYSSFLGEYNKPMQNCLRPENSLDPLFESTFSFENDSPRVTLLSASYSDDLVARPGCFANWTEVFGKGEKVRAKSQDVLIICTSVGLFAFIVACLILLVKLRSGKICGECILLSKHRPQGNIEVLLENYGGIAPKRYKYVELKKITSSFENTLGKGGFGTVYRGRLQDGRLVAVKILHNASSDREDLLNEILSIARTSHVNVVSLVGFCIEGSKHALIYEYMSVEK